MKVFLAGGNDKANIIKQCDESMKIFLAGGNDKANIPPIDISTLFILESYYYMDNVLASLIPRVKSFMLDSGAFTFMQNNQVKKIDWEEYIHRYADFIVKNDVKLFFELDIDSIVGYDKVKKYRKLLEDLTNRQPIPVWHKCRGKNGFLETLDSYPYVAIGGVVIKELSADEYRFFPYFINEAHKRNVKIHGLGFTRINDLKKYHFDSVDSTAWTTGNRFGFIYKFTGDNLIKIDAPKNHRLADARITALNNFTEWVKFQRYAERHL